MATFVQQIVKVSHEQNDAQTVLIQNLLMERWPALSPGEQGIVKALMSEDGEVAMTIADRPHSLFWESLITLGWAEIAGGALHLSLPPSLRAYQFSVANHGRERFIAIHRQYELNTMQSNRERD